MIWSFSVNERSSSLSLFHRYSQHAADVISNVSVSLMRQKRRTGAAGENIQREFLRVLGSHTTARISDASRRGRWRAASADTTSGVFVTGAHTKFRRSDGQSRGLSRTDTHLVRLAAQQRAESSWTVTRRDISGVLTPAVRSRRSRSFAHFFHKATSASNQSAGQAVVDKQSAHSTPVDLDDVSFSALASHL